MEAEEDLELDDLKQENCKICKLSFQTESGVITHYKKIHQPKWTSDLKVHKQTKHKRKFFACDKCEFSTPRAGYPDVHKQFKHETQHKSLDKPMLENKLYSMLTFKFG